MSTNDRHIVISHSVCFLEALKMFYLFALSFSCNYQSNISLYSGIEPLQPFTSALHDCDLNMLAKCTTSAVSVSIKHFLLWEGGKQ